MTSSESLKRIMLVIKRLHVSAHFSEYLITKNFYLCYDTFYFNVLQYSTSIDKYLKFLDM